MGTGISIYRSIDWGTEKSLRGYVEQTRMRKEIVRRFTVGATTEWGPRFFPLSGKSLRLAGAGIDEQLALRRGLAGVRFRLDGAPSGVTLEGSVVRIGPMTLAGRMAAFRVIAEDPAGRADTMHYHLVDPSRFGVTAEPRLGGVQ